MTEYQPAPPTGAESARLAAGVGLMLRAARTAAGWTFAEMGRRSGVAASTISTIERGKTRPSWMTLRRLAAAVHPGAPALAEAFAVRLAEAAGPSLAGPPGVPASFARELVVEILVRSARRVGFDLDDDAVRHVVAAELRAAVGEAGPGAVNAPEAATERPLRAEVVLAIGGKS